MAPDLHFDETLYKLLHKKWAEQPLSAEEEAIVQRWLAKSPDNQHRFQQLADDEWLLDKLAAWKHPEADKVWRMVHEQMHPSIVHRIHFLRTAWFRYAAILLLIAGTIWWLRHPGRNTSEDTQAGVTRPGSLANPTNDLPPGTTKATLTLADGSTIILDSTANGAVANQGTTKIVKPEDGKLAYQSGATSGEIGYNTITTPRGGQYQITLPDGTKAWLNAASSIRFPTAFIGGKRIVEVTGELYLEVAASKSSPFFVKTSNTTVEVLGTSFNVNAYPDEPTDKISLLEGTIRINTTILKPGQAYMNGKITTTNIEQDLAWKNNLFNFEGATVDAFMRQLARWYDIEVVYKGRIPPGIFHGGLGRNLPFSEILQVLNDFKINYKKQGRTLIIE